METLRRLTTLRPSVSGTLNMRITGVLFVIYGIFTFIYQAAEGWKLLLLVTGFPLFFAGIPMSCSVVESREPRFRVGV